MTREGEVVTPFFDIYPSVYMVLGLGEYFKATGNEEALDLAVKTAYRVNGGHSVSPVPGAGARPLL